MNKLQERMEFASSIVHKALLSATNKKMFDTSVQIKGRFGQD